MNPKNVRYGLIAIFWGAVLFTFACAEMPAGAAPRIFPWDKAEHFLAFYVLASLAAVAYPRATLIIVALWLSLYGAAIELVQALPFVHRDCDIWDWVADCVAIGAALAPMLLDRWRRMLATAG